MYIRQATNNYVPTSTCRSSESRGEAGRVIPSRNSSGRNLSRWKKKKKKRLTWNFTKGRGEKERRRHSVHALCVKRVSCIFKKLAADEDRAEEKRTRQKYVNAAAALEIYRPIPLPLVEWKSIPDTSTINGRENNKLGSRSPRMFMSYGPPPNRSAMRRKRHDRRNNDVQTLVAFCFSKRTFWFLVRLGWRTIIFRLFPISKKCLSGEMRTRILDAMCRRCAIYISLYFICIFYEHELWFFVWNKNVRRN